MEIQEYIQRFGYCEMYEWAKIPKEKHGIFVSFDNDNPEKIIPYSNDSEFLGVTSICYTDVSDDPNEWKYSFISNEVGDYYLKKETLAVGVKEYDQRNEISFIKTMPYEHYIRIPNNSYNKEINYVKRTKRNEWVPVNLLGKVIVRDNGECEPGKYCVPYSGVDADLIGKAIPGNKSDKHAFYVLQRLSKETILIINK